MRRNLKLARLKGAAEPAAGGAQCKYLAIIMDGNGRWARRKRLPVAAGHKAGAKSLRRILEHALDLGIKEVTVVRVQHRELEPPRGRGRTPSWTCSSSRSSRRCRTCTSAAPASASSGAARACRRELVRRIEAAEALTAANERLTLFIAFNYGGRQELLDAAAGLAAEWAAAQGAAAKPGDARS